MIKQRPKYISFNILLFIILAQLFSFVYAQNKNNEKSEKFNLVFSNDLFGSVNIKDAEASLLIWAQQYLEGWKEYNGSVMQTNVLFVNELKEVDQIIDSRIPSLITLGTPTYLNNKFDKLYEPIFVGTADSIAMVNLVLIVRKDSKFNYLKELRDSKLSLQVGIIVEITNLWINYLTLSNSNIAPDKFFSEISRESKASKALLNVYFGKSDVCVITSMEYDIVCELNPELKKETRILTSSKHLLPNITFLANNNDKEFSKFIKKFAVDLTSNPYSKQVMKIFRIDGIGAFEERYLVNIRNLLDKYRKLTDGKTGI